MLAKADGQGAHETMRQLASSHGGQDSQCRYLGPQLHWSGGNRPKLKARKAQAWKAFKAYGRFWRTNAPRNFKTNIFTASVLSILTSAATTLVLSKGELKSLTTIYQQMLRVLLQGKACKNKTTATAKNTLRFPMKKFAVNSACLPLRLFCELRG